jgi:DNA-binding CsgD family transcriptional regulator
LQSDHANYAALLATINDAAVGAVDWVEVARELDLHLNVGFATVELFDKKTGESHFVAAEQIDDAARRAYEEHIWQVNPRFVLVPSARVGEVVSDRMIPPEVDAAGGDYYQWLAPTGCRYFAGVKLFETDDFLAVSSINVPRSWGLVDEERQRRFAAISSSLANALQVHQALAPRLDAVEALDEASLGSERVYALLARSGALLACSAAFEHAVAASRVLCLVRGRLQASRPTDQARLGQLLTRVLAGEPPVGAGPLRIEIPGRRHGLLLRAVPLRRARELFARLRPAALLTLIDLDARSAGVAEQLRAGWGLTPREAELAMLIGEGQTLCDAAARLGITEQTARTHLKSIFRRMDVDRQSALVRLIGMIRS